MTSVLALIEPDVDGGNDGFDAEWAERLRKSLAGEQDLWLALATQPGQITDARAWVLLSWVESMAAKLVHERDPADLRLASFAMSLLEATSLDQRDKAVVGSLLRRASVIAGLEFTAQVTAGCREAGKFGEACRRWLTQVSSATPATHTEVGQGSSFAFSRQHPGFTVGDLEHWLGD